MSRMLKALKQLESRSSQPQRDSRSVPPEGPDSRQFPTHDASEVAVDPSPPAADADPHDSDPRHAAAEAILARVESAAEAAGRRPDQAPPEPQVVSWPVQTTEEHAQSFRTLAESVLSQVSPGRGATLMFTSPSDLEGKSRLMASLAAAIAQQSPHSVLLVDGNLHNPDLASWLGIQASRGLSQVLTGAAAWRQVVRKTSVPRLDLLPGVKFPTPGVRVPEHLNFRPLLDELHGSYRAVLIDAASLVHAEVAPIASCCLGTYLVVQLGHTTRRNLARAVEVIRDCRGHLLGGVVIAGAWSSRADPTEKRPRAGAFSKP